MNTTDIPTKTTTEARSIFLREPEVTIGSPQSPQQLADAVNAHAAYLRWDKERSKDTWMKFIKMWSKVES